MEPNLWKNTNYISNSDNKYYHNHFEKGFWQKLIHGSHVFGKSVQDTTWNRSLVILHRTCPRDWCQKIGMAPQECSQTSCHGAWLKTSCRWERSEWSRPWTGHIMRQQWHHRCKDWSLNSTMNLTDDLLWRLPVERAHCYSAKWRFIFGQNKCTLPPPVSNPPQLSSDWAKHQSPRRVLGKQCW